MRFTGILLGTDVYRCDSNAHTSSARTEQFCYARLVETLFYYLAIVQIGVGLYLLWGGLQWLGYARRRLRGDPGFRAPRCAVL